MSFLIRDDDTTINNLQKINSTNLGSFQREHIGLYLLLTDFEIEKVNQFDHYIDFFLSFQIRD